MIPRPEHPRPQFVRENWLNLNGQWQFEIDNGRSGEERGLQKEGTALSGSITVPFCPESRLSGVEHTDFMYGVWYKRTVNLPKQNGRTLLHFGAVDYTCKAFVNGIPVGTHSGGYVSFFFDITDALREGENEIAVYAEDDTRSGMIPSGKQCEEYASAGCSYTRTTGIWQTVWLEFMPESHIVSVKYFPNVADTSVTVEAELCGSGDLSCDVSFAGAPMGSCAVKNAAGHVTFTVALSEAHLWEVGKGNLYDVSFTFGEDKAESYFGLRQIRLDGHKFLLNGKSVFQRLVLDQGFYPDGIYTAPTDEDLVGDIQLSMDVGFNGARLHEKIFEERFLYHADRMGYLVWGEYPDWGLDYTKPESIYGILPEWTETLRRDFNHPAIIGWCPFNETWPVRAGKQYDPCIIAIHDVTKAIDPTRPCIDSSGGYHVKSDIYDTHDYCQDPEEFRANYAKLTEKGVLYNRFDDMIPYAGGPTFISEYGGIAWNMKEGGWGYGHGPETLEEFYTRFKGLTDVLLDNTKMLGFCYTQLTDIEQEQNGIYYYDRTPKFDAKRLHAILSRKAAIED